MFKVAHKTENIATPSYLRANGKFGTPHRFNTLKAKTYEMIQAGKRFMIYSPNEAQMEQRGGYWSNDDGWVDLDSATIFDWSERKTFCLPASLGSDADWIEIDGDGTPGSEIHLPAVGTDHRMAGHHPSGPGRRPS